MGRDGSGKSRRTDVELFTCIPFHAAAAEAFDGLVMTTVTWSCNRELNHSKHAITSDPSLVALTKSSRDHTLRSGSNSCEHWTATRRVGRRASSLQVTKVISRYFRLDSIVQCMRIVYSILYIYVLLYRLGCTYRLQYTVQ